MSFPGLLARQFGAKKLNFANKMMDETQKNSARLTDLETSLMHLQNDFDSLNEVVLISLANSIS